MNKLESLKEIVNDFPELSGVYLMLDIDGKIIYIGKAKSLRSRVKQYFYSKHKDIKTRMLVSHIDNVNVIITKNEYEALVLENNLIKEYKPYYNFLLKDDKTYAYIKIGTHLDFPTFEVVRKFDDNGKYFGPFLLGVSASRVLTLVHDLFPIRSCKRNLARKSKPCLEFHLGRCLAPCAGNVSKEEYAKVVKDATILLSGQDKKARSVLFEKIRIASSNEDFELAIKYRDYLTLLDKIARKQTASVNKSLNADVFSLAEFKGFTVINRMSIRGGRLIASSNTEVETVEGEDIISRYIIQYYEKNPLIASEIILSNEALFIRELEEHFLENKKTRVKICVPVKGIKRELANLSQKNANEHLENYYRKVEKKEEKAKEELNRLSSLLGLGSLSRIECFDVSHIGGTNVYASMVVFNNGEKDKKQYRIFKVENKNGGDDYASLQESLKRRVEDLSKSNDMSFGTKPDLVIIDGGKGQLAVAKDILLPNDIKVIAIAEKNEEIFVPFQSHSILLDKGDPALHLCQRIRDEAHRFALYHHTKRRNKEMLKSELGEIPGIGEVKVKMLYLHFGTLERIKEASIEELEKVDKINKRDAEVIYSFYR